MSNDTGYFWDSPGRQNTRNKQHMLMLTPEALKQQAARAELDVAELNQTLEDDIIIIPLMIVIVKCIHYYYHYYYYYVYYHYL